MNKNYWLLKTEPNCWSWQQQVTKQVEHWDGVRNFTARNNMQKMLKGDLAFFYHTGDERRIMGIVKVVNEYYPDPADPRFGMVDVETVSTLERPVSLQEIKGLPQWQSTALLNQSRLSVVPIHDHDWQTVLALSQSKFAK